MTDTPTAAAPSRADLAAQRDALNRELAAADLAVIEALDGALASDGVQQLRAIVSAHYDPAARDGLNVQLGYLQALLESVPANLARLRTATGRR